MEIKFWEDKNSNICRRDGLYDVLQKIMNHSSGCEESGFIFGFMDRASYDGIDALYRQKDRGLIFAETQRKSKRAEK